MKKTIIFAAFAALVLGSACSERVDIPEFAGENVISLDLVYGDPATRADEPQTTDGTSGENKVSSVQYFLYNDVEADPIYASEYVQNPTLTDLKYSVTLKAGENGVPDLTTLFMNGECIVYGVFNTAQIAAAPLATVKTTALVNTFAHEGEEAGTSTGSKWIVNLDSDQNFAMAGELALTRVSGQAYAAKGTVEMNRVAAKIAVDLKIKKEVTGKDNKVWVPMLGGNQIRLYPQNVAGAAVLGGADAAAPTYPTNLDQFTYKEIVYNSEIGSDYVTEDDTKAYYVIESQQDFYTYPQAWTKGSDDEPFIKVIVPWRGKTGATSQKEIYYKVMLPVEKIEANKYYKLTVVVSVLGTEGEPEVTLEPLSAMVVDWQGGGNINGTISAAKYLSVERGVVTATSSFDTAEGRFEFYSAYSGTTYAASDPVTVTIKEIKQQNLRTGNWEYLYQNGSPNTSVITSRKDATGRTLTVAEVEGWVNKVGDNYLEFGHLLNASLTSPFMDVTPYYYTAELSLPAEIDPSKQYSKTVTFVQWPEVYVVSDPNSNNGSNVNTGVYINGNNTTTTTWQVGTDDEWDRQDQRTTLNLGGANGFTGNPGNKNPNMYILTISVSDTYVIGDPRTDEVSMPDFHWRYRYRQYNWGWNYTYGEWTDNWAQGRWTEDASVTNHVLTYYHPAAANSNVKETSEMIAPKIRVASSYGVCLTGRSREEAILRCATYQEDGIPAGRWRLPTFAEVEFIANLSSLGRIPYLFGQSSDNGQTPTASNTHYWTANGLIEINNGNSSGTTAPHVTRLPNATDSSYDNESVRCVYDEWFWGDATTRPAQKNQFTWGDRNY